MILIVCLDNECLICVQQSGFFKTMVHIIESYKTNSVLLFYAGSHKKQVSHVFELQRLLFIKT